jgi:hypothetical protein
MAADHGALANSIVFKLECLKSWRSLVPQVLTKSAFFAGEIGNKHGCVSLGIHNISSGGLSTWYSNFQRITKESWLTTTSPSQKILTNVNKDY